MKLKTVIGLQKRTLSMNHPNNENNNDLSPYIKEIQISRYKAFNENVKIDFKGEPRVFLIIGNNASGKTAILDGIAKCLSWVTKRIIAERRTANMLEETAINTKNDPQASAHFKVTLGSNNLTNLNIRLSKSQKGAIKTFNNEVEETESFAKKIRKKLNADFNSVLPLWAYYAVDRNFKGNKKTGSMQERVSAYDSVLDGGNSSWNQLLEWIELCFDKKAYQKTPSELNTKFLYEQMMLIDAQIKDFDNKDDFNEMNDTISKLPQLLTEMINSKMEAKLIENENHKNSALDVFISMMKKFLNNISSMKMEVIDNKKTLLIHKVDNTVFDINELSQGEKSILIIIGDLIRRMSILNPHLENPLETPAVVLVDEIDLHLHPLWQQQIVQKLEDIFPKTQFILSTHSPIVLSSVNNEDIFVLKKDNKIGTYVYKSDKQSKGSSVDYNLAYYQETDDHIQDLKEYKYILQYQSILDKNQEDSEEGNELKEKIIAHFGRSHPLWLDFQRQLIFKRRKQLLHEKATKTLM